MGTHPIFESDFDCLTEMSDVYRGNMENGSPAKSTKPTSGKSGNSNVATRLQTELMQLMMEPSDGISAFPDGDNLFRWIGTIVGPQQSPYQGLEFKLQMEFPDNYPF